MSTNIINNANNDSSIGENNTQILDNIQNLQQMEQQMFTTLEINTNLSSQQQTDIVNKINEISNMRVNLYQTLQGVNSFYNNALHSSIGTLKEQTAAISIVESELNRAKKRLELLEAEKNNKIRLVEINDYYSDKYAEHASLMKIIIFTLIPVIFLAILNNKGILPNSFFYILLTIIVIIGSVFFWYKLGSILMRDNMNYQEYNWYFNPSTATTTTTSTTNTSNDPWSQGSAITTTCIGQSCCSTGQIYDISLNQCVTSDTGTASSAVESFVNKVLTKTSRDNYIDNVVPYAHHSNPLIKPYKTL